ncbi:hypothetical protein B7P43_G11865 [Cryptotermes secundus]|uniref:Mos1 transposase HTH domain-containing protein n=1 Tax=Cryptotermes secundus TaxID=105785 RepID=A0A2J7QKR4_9NEOP|nr:hypothetical protein B7P43_G11865 [Cryptotermes secundus]
MATLVEKVVARAVIWFLHLQGKSTREIHDQMTAVYQEGVPSYDTVVRWKRHFHCGQTNLEVEPGSGRSFAEEPGIVAQVESRPGREAYHSPPTNAEVKKTGDETWVHHYEPEYGAETPGIANEEEIQDSIFRGEGDANRFGGSKGPILEDYLEKWCTVNSARYSDLLANNLKPAIRTKRRGLLSKDVLLHDNARPHMAGQTVPEQPAYSPDLAPFRLSSLWTAQSCFTDKEVREAVHKWLQGQPKPFFLEVRKLGDRWTEYRKGRRLCRKMTYLFNPYFSVYKLEKQECG